MDRPTCKTCPYFLSDEGHVRDGECIRRSPTPIVSRCSEDWFAAGVWPEVYDDDTCGEHPDFPVYMVSVTTGGPKPGLPGRRCPNCFKIISGIGPQKADLGIYCDDCVAAMRNALK